MKILFLWKRENFMASIGLCQISAMAKDIGHETYLCDMNVEHYMDAMMRVQPDVVACGMMTGDAKHYILATHEIKKVYPNVKIIGGGVHCTFFPEMIHKTSMDAIVIGEADHAFQDLLISIDNHVGYEGIKNVVTRDTVNPLQNIRPLIANLDSLPHPDYGLVYDNTPLGKSTLKLFMTSRGCPARCAYCFNDKFHEMYKGKGTWGHIRRNSVDYVIEGFRRIQRKYPFNFCKIYDDILFTHVDDWVIEFAERFPAEVGIPFFCFGRADLMTEDMVRLLKQAGCHTISMSIESGNEHVRKDLMHRQMTNEEIVEAHLLCLKYGIKTFTNVVLGIPDTTLEEEIDSLDLAIKSKVDWIEYAIFEPYPGTWLGDYAVNKGYFDAEYDNMHTGYHYKSPLTCFSEERKRQQLAFTTIGVVASLFPFLRNWFVRSGMNKKLTKFWLFIYWLVKMYVVRYKLYPSGQRGLESLRIYWRSWKQEKFKHSEETNVP